VSPGEQEQSALEQAAAVAERNHQIAIWDRSQQRHWAIALYDLATKELLPLRDEQASRLLNGDPLIRREWVKWNSMTRNEGGLVVIDVERARRVLAATTDQDHDGDPA
jgi:hypothetical protein